MKTELGIIKNEIESIKDTLDAILHETQYQTEEELIQTRKDIKLNGRLLNELLAEYRMIMGLK